MPGEVELDRSMDRDDAGNLYMVIVYQEYIQDRNPDKEQEGFNRWTTSKELHLHIIDPNTLKYSRPARLSGKSDPGTVQEKIVYQSEWLGLRNDGAECFGFAS